MSTTTITTIELPVQREDALFDGTSDQDRAGIDIPASIERYHAEWRRRVEQAYPGADVRLSLDARRVIVTGPADPGEDEFTVQALGEALFDDGNAWMVEVVQ